MRVTANPGSRDSHGSFHVASVTLSNLVRASLRGRSAQERLLSASRDIFGLAGRTNCAAPKLALRWSRKGLDLSLDEKTLKLLAGSTGEHASSQQARGCKLYKWE